MRNLAVILLSVLAGCGFHLQGRMPLPDSIRRAYVESGDAQSDFVRALRASLAASGVELVDRPQPTAATIQVLRDRVSERVLTVSARNIPTDYELTYDVEIGVRGAGRELMTPEELSLSRTYSFDEARLLAKDREKAVLQDALARDMAGVVLRRLSTLP